MTTQNVQSSSNVPSFLKLNYLVLRTSKVNDQIFNLPEKLVYSYLLQWQETHQKVFPSQKRICEDLGIGSRTSITKYLTKLVSMGLLTIYPQKGKSCVYEPVSLLKVLRQATTPMESKNTPQVPSASNFEVSKGEDLVDNPITDDTEWKDEKLPF